MLQIATTDVNDRSAAALDRAAVKVRAAAVAPAGAATAAVGGGAIAPTPADSAAAGRRLLARSFAAAPAPAGSRPTSLQVISSTTMRDKQDTSLRTPAPSIAATPGFAAALA